MRPLRQLLGIMAIALTAIASLARADEYDDQLKKLNELKIKKEQEAAAALGASGPCMSEGGPMSLLGVQSDMPGKNIGGVRGLRDGFPETERMKKRQADIEAAMAEAARQFPPVPTGVVILDFAAAEGTRIADLEGEVAHLAAKKAAETDPARREDLERQYSEKLTERNAALQRRMDMRVQDERHKAAVAPFQQQLQALDEEVRVMCGG